MLCSSFPFVKKVREVAEKTLAEIESSKASKIIRELDERKREVQIIFINDFLGNPVVSHLLIKELQNNEVR